MATNLAAYLLMTAIDLTGTSTGFPREHWAMTKLVESIGHVESGMNHEAVGDSGKAKGAWQMHAPAWKDAQEWYDRKGITLRSYRYWRNPSNQATAANGYIRLCQERLMKAGVANPDPRQIYLCFSMGFADFKAIGFDPEKAPASKLSSANRVLNIFQK
jgi:hypothetical protein